MPPYCCGSNRGAKDVAGERKKESLKQVHGTSDEILTADVEYVRPLTLKFYARHDWPYFNCTEEEIHKMRAQHDTESLKRAAKLTTTDKSSPESIVEPSKYVVKHNTAQPITTNQIYGWYHDRGYRYLKSDRGVFIFPREEDPLIKQILRDRLVNSLSR